jgi:tRNA (cytidine32/uridine32-2'-O)-methyltransferase
MVQFENFNLVGLMGAELEFIRIVLVEPTHPGNIGASARAMKTMGFSNLHLVRPKLFPSADATARAAGADDILECSTVHDSLTDAVKDCVVVYGTSARLRNLSSSVLSPDKAVSEILRVASKDSQVAIIFGRERSGLTNEELDSCNKMIVIPTSHGFSSLNLASAVQIFCYEVFKSVASNNQPENPLKKGSEIVSNAELYNLYIHLQECLVEIDFLDPKKPRRLMRRLKLLFNRATLDQNEYNILRGILTAVQESLKKK